MSSSFPEGIMQAASILLICIFTRHTASSEVVNVRHPPKLPKQCGSVFVPTVRNSYFYIICRYLTPQSSPRLTFLRQSQIGSVFLSFYKKPNADVDGISLKLTASNTELEDGTFLKMPNLESLTLFGCYKKHITRKFFEGLDNLKELMMQTIVGLCVSTFSPDWLVPLSSLQKLDLTQNNIVTFPAKTFCNAQNLITLNISFNQLKESESLGIMCVGKNPRESCLPCLPYLTVIDISHNFISILNVSLSRDLPRLQHLVMTDSHLSKLALDGNALNMLVELDLTSNLLSSLTVENMEECNGSYLETLKLANNQINFISEGFFLCTELLRHLDISANNLSNVRLVEAGIPSLWNLEYLNINENKIHILQASLIGNLTHLIEFSCSRCAIVIIEKNAFLYLRQLQVLRLNSNAITTLEADIFAYLPNLDILDLSDNALLKFEGEAGIRSLTSLNLSGNSIQKLPDFRQLWYNLNTLDLSRNNITELPSSMFFLPKLKRLNLAFNSIKIVHVNALFGLMQLVVVDISNNVIDKIGSYSFRQNINMKVLKLNNNRISNLNRSLIGIRPQTYVDLSRNLIKELDIENQITSMSRIDLSWNQISFIYPYFFKVTKLQFMNLTFNKLYHLDVSTLEIRGGKQRPQVLLEGNRLHCDCHNELITTLNSDT